VLVTFVAVYRFSGRILRATKNHTLAQGAVIGVFICTPALLLDGVLYAVNGGRYPGLTISASGMLSATLLLAYAAALVAALGAAARGPVTSAR
jgi:hypothetical protein